MSFAAYQIVFIEKGNTRLYGELVQHIEDRHTCWLRPISLRLVEPDTGEIRLLDVGDGPDIICSIEQVKPALDTDWIMLQADLAKGRLKCDYSEANHHLRQFFEQLLCS